MLNQSQNVTNYHVEYMDVIQHWSPYSEGYAGGDALVTMLTNGWKMHKSVREEIRSFAGSTRSVTIYHITLERDGEICTMPVLRNPYIHRMMIRDDIEIIHDEAH